MMERDPDIRREHADAGSQPWSSADESRDWSHLPPAPGIRHIDDRDADAEEEARVLEDLAAGRTYPHAIVSEWLLTWGKPGRKPFKEWLADRHG